VTEQDRLTCTHIGGQAVIEGVMMRGKYNWAVSARDPQGEIHSEEHDLISAASKNTWMKWPLVRGVVALVESLALGTKALTASARLAGQDEEGEEELTGGMMAGALAMGILLAIAIFMVFPALATNFAVGLITENPILWNMVNGLFSVFAFLIYVWAIGLMPDMKRVFRYHGAEHRVIHAVEAGDELTPENCMRYPNMHVRCGTSFLLMVMVLSIIIFSLIPIRAIVAGMGIDNRILVTLIAMISRLSLMPVIAGLAYEVTVKWAGPRADNWLVKILLWPGLQMQRLTTAEPTLDMIEVAIASTNRVIAREEREARGETGDIKEEDAGEQIPAEFDLLDDVI